MLLIFCGCQAGVKSKLCGAWVIEDAPKTLTMEFFRDGTVKTVYKVGAEINGTWIIDSDKQIKIDMDFWKLTARFIDSRKLLLMSEGKEKVYTKVKSNKK